MLPGTNANPAGSSMLHKHLPVDFSGCEAMQWTLPLPARWKHKDIRLAGRRTRQQKRDNWHQQPKFSDQNLWQCNLRSQNQLQSVDAPGRILSSSSPHCTRRRQRAHGFHRFLFLLVQWTVFRLLDQKPCYTCKTKQVITQDKDTSNEWNQEPSELGLAAHTSFVDKMVGHKLHLNIFVGIHAVIVEEEIGKAQDWRRAVGQQKNIGSRIKRTHLANATKIAYPRKVTNIFKSSKDWTHRQNTKSSTASCIGGANDRQPWAL